jgi:hypothetical protein
MSANARMMKTLAAAAAVPLVLLVAACAQPSRPGAAGNGAADGPSGYDADTVVLRVEYTGGFMPPEALAARLPIVTVYGDGRVITEGPQILIYPGPALPNVQQSRIAPEAVQALVELAVSRGIGTLTPEDVGEPPVADAPSTRFTVDTGDGTEVLEVYALAEGTDDLAGSASGGLTEEQVAARSRLRDLVAALTDLPATLGADSVGEPEPYVPTTIAAVASPWTPDEELPEQPEVTWPGPDLPGETLNAALGLACVTVTGPEATELLELAASATVATPWTSGGESWRVALRPLLPDETGCADLMAG